MLFVKRIKKTVLCFFGLFAFSFLFLGCSDQPKRAKFPGPPGRTADFEQAQRTQEVLGGFDSFGRSLGDARDNTIGGIVSLAEGLSKPEKDFVVFISARPLGGGPPLAAKKMRVERIPFRFSLSEADLMLPGTRFQGEVYLTVRLAQVDESGSIDPLRQLPGDLYATTRASTGVTDIRINIDQVVD